MRCANPWKVIHVGWTLCSVMKTMVGQVELNTKAEYSVKTCWWTRTSLHALTTNIFMKAIDVWSVFK